MKKHIYFLSILFGTSFTPTAFGLSFIFPTTCQLNNTCYIQQYVDHQPQLNGRDFQGGQLASAYHRGTDIALPSFTIMDQNVRVLAAAKGKVLQVQNKQVDNTKINFAELDSKNCGNFIIIQHNDNWQTQYCHLKQLSTRVKPGQQVNAGEVIANIGSSGFADYPGLEFIITQDDKVVDPFANKLWQSVLDYQGTGLIDIGVALTPVTFDQLIKSPPKIASFSLTDTTIYPWVRLFGVRAYAEQRFVFYDNKGKIYRINTLPPTNQFYPSLFAYTTLDIATKIGIKQTGTWKVAYQLKQDDHDWQTIGEVSFLLKFYR